MEYNVYPFFKSHYSLGRSILTLGSQESENHPDSIFEIAKENNLTISQAEEIFRLFCNKISDEISSVKKTDGLFNPEKFNIIHIDNFGKFVPNQRKIRHAICTLILD